MSRITPHQSHRGFLTIAQNTDVDYLNLAYTQAMSIKLVMPNSEYAVIVDQNTMELITGKHRKVFDYIIELPTDNAKDQTWKLSNEWQVFFLTPFKETIKLESDILFTRSIEHWWDTFRLKNIVLSLGCRDHVQKLSSNRSYRRLFDDNELPDVYNGLMYFRYSMEANTFFNYARMIYNNWPYVRDQMLVNCRDDLPTTDVVYALSAKILGVEHCTLPQAEFINFTHMKPAINNFSHDKNWTQIYLCETDLPMIRINNLNQYHPLHYYEKDFVTEELTKEYENGLE